jgi:hypothetical protein
LSKPKPPKPIKRNRAIRQAVTMPTAKTNLNTRPLDPSRSSVVGLPATTIAPVSFVRARRGNPSSLSLPRKRGEFHKGRAPTEADAGMIEGRHAVEGGAARGKMSVHAPQVRLRFSSRLRWKYSGPSTLPCGSHGGVTSPCGSLPTAPPGAPSRRRRARSSCRAKPFLLWEGARVDP